MTPKVLNNTIEIKQSKTKLFLLLAASAMFVLLGYWLFINANEPSYRYSPVVVKTAGIISILFFGTTFIYALIKLFDNKPGLIINEKGITDNASAVSAGFIAWSEITGINVEKIQSTPFLLIYTKNPEKYIIGNNKFKANIMRINAKMYGTPLSISATALQYNFNDLKALILTNLETYR